METTMPRSALRHRAINTDRTLLPVAIRTSRRQPEPVSTTHAISAYDQAPQWPWLFGAGMFITLVILLIGHLIKLPAL